MLSLKSFPLYSILIIAIVSFFVNLVNAIAGGFIALIGLGGCLLFFIFAGPFGIYLLLNPLTALLLLFLFLFPILGRSFVSFLKYVHYMVTEYLFENIPHFSNMATDIKGLRKQSEEENNREGKKKCGDNGKSDLGCGRNIKIISSYGGYNSLYL